MTEFGETYPASTSDWLVLAGLSLVFLGGLWRAKQIWKDETADLDGFPDGLLRAFPTMIVSATLALALGTALAALPENGQLTVMEVVLFFSTMAAFVGGVGLTLSVGLASKPRSFVPPHLRARRPRSAKGSD